MDPAARWRTVESLYHSARERPPEARAAFLSEACAGDEDLRRDVESLLSQPVSVDGVLDGPALAVARQVMSEPHRVSLVGRRLGLYQVVAPLGAGGMGEVYRARDTRLGREVALKVLPTELTADPDRLVRFEREARLLAALNHPNIATIHGFETFDDTHTLVMELVEGDTLAERIHRSAGRKSAGLPIADTLAIARQIADALDAAHEKGIVHRDLKPANIKITPEGVVKVLDFGIAKLTPTIADDQGASADSPTITVDGTREGLIVGTAAYMSPEQARGHLVDRRTDIWAFGCVLYEMLTGRTPFGRATLSDTIAAILEREPDWSLLPAVTPAAASRLLHRCLDKDARRRQRDIGDAIHEIDDSLRAGTAPSVAPLVQPQRTVRTRLLWSAIGAAGALAILFPFLRPTDTAGVNPLENAQFTRLTDFEGAELDPSISPDGRFVVFLSDRDGPVDVWVTQVGTGEFRNLTAGRVPDLLNELVRNVGFSADGSRIWFRVASANGRHDTWIMPTIGGTARPFLDRAVGAAWAQDGSRLVYHEFTPGDPMFVTDRDGGNGRKIFVDQPGFHTHFLTWALDGRFLYFARGLPVTADMDIWRLAASGGDPERITNHRNWVASPVALDDRTLLYSAIAEDGSGPWLYSVDVDQRVPRRLSLGIEQYTAISATADGRRLVAAVTRPSGRLWTLPILTRPADETDAVQLDVMNVRAVKPRYTRDGLLYLSSRGEGDGLWLFRDQSSRELWKGSDTGQVSSPAVASNGALSFTLRRNGRGALYVMNGDGTDVRTLAESLNVSGVPSWSPDARSIVVAANQGSGPRLFKVPVDGGAPVQLVDEMATHPVWSPDGRLIVYSGPNISLQALLKAISPDGQPVALPPLSVRILGERYRFTPDSKGLVFMRGDWQDQQFHVIDLETGQERRLSNLKPSFTLRSFDVSPDGTQIVFDRVRENADLVLIDLKQPPPR